MDALSDVLRAVRLTGAIFFDIHASDPWVAETPGGPSIVAAMFRTPSTWSVTVITQGSCWASFAVSPGVAFGRRHHRLPARRHARASSVPGLRRAPDLAMYRHRRRIAVHAVDGDGEAPTAAFAAGFRLRRDPSIRC
jgi:hypothetical protein